MHITRLAGGLLAAASLTAVVLDQGAAFANPAAQKAPAPANAGPATSAPAVAIPASGGVCNPGCSANATFKSYGEIFTVHDYSADGYSTVGYLYTWNGSAWKLHGSAWDRNGYAGPPVTKNFSIPEGTPVAYDACLVTHDHTTAFHCSNYYYDKA